MENKIIDLIPATGTDYALVVGTDTIWTNAEFYVFARSKMRDYVFDSVADTLALAKSELKEDYVLWCSTMGDNIKRALDAFYAEYNPIENYNREELGSEEVARHKGSTVTRTIEEEGEETDAHHKGTKTSTGEETISTPRVETKTTTFKTAFDSDTETETDALTTVPTAGTDKIERDAAKNYVTTQDIDASTYDKDVKSFDDRKTTETTTSEDIDGTTYDRDVTSFDGRITRGNIGTLTTQSMIASELELRKRNLVFEFMAAFINDFCYMVEGV